MPIRIIITSSRPCSRIVNAVSILATVLLSTNLLLQLSRQNLSESASAAFSRSYVRSTRTFYPASARFERLAGCLNGTTIASFCFVAYVLMGAASTSVGLGDIRGSGADPLYDLHSEYLTGFDVIYMIGARILPA